LLDAIQSAGYHGVQFGDAHPVSVIEETCERGLGMAQFREIRLPSQAAAAAESLAAQGAECGIVHLGYGLEDETEAAQLIESVLNATETFGVPLYVETHRATLTQDMWRTVQFARRFPELRFNGDFSHWYTGQEMVYGDFERKLKFLTPVLERVRFLHGRIGNPGCIQVDIGDGDVQRHPYVAHFRKLWTAAFTSFLGSAKPTDFICFTPELLAPEIYYARVFPDAPGRLVEESDRWQQSLVLAGIARECFNDALRAAELPIV
jgi:sugar phosphate isomerase/epimerase